MFTTAHWWTLPWAKQISSTSSDPFSLRSYLISSSHLYLSPRQFLSFKFYNVTFYTFLIPPHTNIWWKTKTMKPLTCNHIPSHITSSTWDGNILLRTLLLTFSQPADYIQYANRNTPLEIHFMYLGNKEFHCIFKTCCIISGLLSTRYHLFNNFIFFCSYNIHVFHKAHTKI